MRHNLAHRKLGRVSEHRTALLRNQAMALIRHERIETTMPKAKELRPFVERLITIAKRGVASGEANGASLHARRLVLQELPDKGVVGKLFESIAPRYAERPGWRSDEGPRPEEHDPSKSRGQLDFLDSLLTALRLRGGNDFRLRVLRDLVVVRELHVVRAAPACRRREVLLVGEHLGHRHLR